MNNDAVPDAGKSFGSTHGKKPSQSWRKRLLKAFALTAAVLHANVETVDGIEWNYHISRGKAEIYRGKNKSAIPSSTAGDITVPATLGGYPVSEVGNYAFYSCGSITSIAIPEGVKAIGGNAFYNCSSLTNISIPDSVTQIRADAFRMCNPELYDTATIDNIKLVDGWVVGFLSPEIADIKLCNVRGIVCNACENYSRLQTLEITGDFKYMGSYAFSGCRMLQSIVLDAPIETIGFYAFDRCVELSHIELPSTVRDIQYSAFSQCFALTNITIPASVTNIGEEAFYGCDSIKMFKIPESVRHIGAGAFSSCRSLEEFVVPNGHKYYELYRDMLFTKDCGELVAGTVALESAVIPGATSNIMAYAFYNCTNLKHVDMGTGVREIGFAAFHGCESLAYIRFPEKLGYVDALAFGYCESLAEIDVPAENADMYMSAFIGCPSIARVYLADTYTGPTSVFPDTAKIIRYSLETEAAAEDGSSTLRPMYMTSLEGAVDANLQEKISTEEKYAYFLSWVADRSKTTFENVMASPYAWLSYALDNDGVITVPPRTENVRIVGFSRCGNSNSWDITASVDGFPIGASATKDNLEEIFQVEGADTLAANALSATNVSTIFDAPIDGKLKIRVRPKADGPERFFFGIRIK